MLGILYTLLGMLLGMEISKGLLAENKKNQQNTGNLLWVFLPASYGIGTLLLGWATYFLAWLGSVILNMEHPLFLANLVVMPVTASGLALVYLKRYAKAVKPEVSERNLKLFYMELGFFVLLFLFLTWMMFYVFHIKDGVLYSGFTVYGDYAPHTAMMRSFSRENNFPTQYPHFGGEDVKYHFMFQFLTGNLEYLGLRLDFAYNLVSVLSLGGFLMLLYALAVRVTRSRLSGVITIFLFFFRSGFTFFRFAWEHIKAGDFWSILAENTNFIGYTPNENWGLWNLNVYLNQRHLAFGLLLAGVVLWVYMDWVDAADCREEKGIQWLSFCFLSREAWKSRNMEQAVLIGLLLGLGTFWNGAAVIGGLLILAGFGIFSVGKLDYAVSGGLAVFLSLLQSKIFIRGTAVKPAFQWGFLAEDTSLSGVGFYLLSMSGIFFLGLLVLAFFAKRKSRVIMAAFSLPAVFAFCVSLTPDINVNHKYVMISYAFLAIFWAGVLAFLWKRAGVGRVCAVFLAFVLTVTGIYDFVVILKGNNQNHRVGIVMESETTDWLSDNLGKEDLLLTPEYSMSEVTMSGVMMYLGWPYYAWSAGYDTNYRASVAVEIYTTENQEQLRETVKEEGITHILFEEGMEIEGYIGREDIIAKTYPLVYNSEDGRIRIYET